MNREHLIKLWYHLTAYVPRKLPTTEAEFLAFRDILLKYYDIKDEPQSYAVLAGQIQGTPGHKIRKPIGHIANHIKRVKINALAQCYRIAANQQLEHNLAEKMKEVAQQSEVSSEKPISDARIQSPKA
jgi:hypothetical protein